MSDHCMSPSAIRRRRWLEGMTDDELRSAMMEASAIIRQRERASRDEFRRACERIAPEFFGKPIDGGRP